MDGSNATGEPRAAFEQYRVLLFSIAYRMTGCASDAEDLVQETYLRYHAHADQAIGSLKAYLSTIITRLALDQLASARATREQYLGTWLPEPILTGEGSGLPLAELEQQEALSLAVLRLLEVLSPPERAVLLLHEVFGYSFDEVGPMLDKRPATCRQILHRARQALLEQRVRFQPEPGRQRQLLLSFLAACQAGEMATLTSLLAEDVVTWSDGGGKVPSQRAPIYGKDAVARFWGHWLGPTRARQQPLEWTLVEINGSQALLCWEQGNLAIVIGVTVSEVGIQEIDAVLSPEKLTFLRQQLAGAGRHEHVT